MTVISDTTALTSLIKIGEEDLLHRLFGEVVIPHAVRDELLDYHERLPLWLRVETIADRSSIDPLLAEIDLGEAEGILLAEQLRANLLIIDEKRGRQIAEKRGVLCIGLAGVVLLAKRNGQIESVGPYLDRLESEAHFRLSTAVKREVLKAAGE